MNFTSKLRAQVLPEHLRHALDRADAVWQLLDGTCLGVGVECQARTTLYVPFTVQRLYTK